MSGQYSELIREFRTRQFVVRIEALPDEDLDLSWDGDGSTREGLDDGSLIAFCAKATVFCNGHELTDDFLGGCIYKSLDDFMDHRAVGATNKRLAAEGKVGRCGSYFHDMIRTVCAQARAELAKLGTVKVRSAGGAL